MFGFSKKLEYYLQSAVFASTSLLNLVNDMLDMAKMENSSFKLNNEYFNMIEVINKAFQIVQFSAYNKQLKLMLVIDESKPYIFTRVLSDKRRIL